MTDRIELHPDNPQPRGIAQAAAALSEGKVLALPTDSGYALACTLGNKAASDTIRHIRGLDKHHNFTLLCPDLGCIATYARVDNPAFRILKQQTPGPFTFILPATREVPRRLMQPKRKTIGIRVPDYAICQALLTEIGEPLMSVSLRGASSSLGYADSDEVLDELDPRVDVFIDAGYSELGLTTVVDLSDGDATILRQGLGQF